MAIVSLSLSRSRSRSLPSLSGGGGGPFALSASSNAFPPPPPLNEHFIRRILPPRYTINSSEFPERSRSAKLPRASLGSEERGGN